MLTLKQHTAYGFSWFQNYLTHLGAVTAWVEVLSLSD